MLTKVGRLKWNVASCLHACLCYLGPLKNLENLYPEEVSTSPSRALPSQTSWECILYLFANLLFIAGGRSGPGRWLRRRELGCWLFIKHVHWYLSYNIRSIVASLIPRINSDTPHSRRYLEEDISGYYFHGYFSGFKPPSKALEIQTVRTAVEEGTGHFIALM